MRPLSWTDAALVALGIGTGAVGHEAAVRHKRQLERGGHTVVSPEGLEIGGLIGAVSNVAALVLDNRELQSFGTGVGVGVAAHDVSVHIRRKERFRPMLLMGQEPISKRWEARVEVDPKLPIMKKEAIAMGLLRDLAAQASDKKQPLIYPELALPPEQVEKLRRACARLSDYLGIVPGNPTEMVKVQRWFQVFGFHRGGYEANESMSHPDPKMRRLDVDRFRLLPLLMEEWERKGSISYDCDDVSAGLGAMAWYNGLRPHLGFISQRTSLGGGLPPNHHTFPVMQFPDGQLWALEGIRPIRPFPLSMAGKVFKPLTRLTIVPPIGGSWEHPI